MHWRNRARRPALHTANAAIRTERVDVSMHTARPAPVHALSTEELGERAGLKGEPSRDHRDESAESLTRLRAARAGVRRCCRCVVIAASSATHSSPAGA